MASATVMPMSDPLFQRALQLHQSGQVAQALDIYNQLLPWQPNNDQLLYMAAMAHLQTGRTLDGIALLQQSLTIRPDNAAGQNNYGRALQSLGEWSKALESYQAALNIKPDYAEALYHQGVVLMELQRLEEALASLDRAVGLAPNFAEAHAGRGAVLRELVRPEEALASYDRALALRPDNAELHNSRGITLRDMMRLDEALVSLDRAIALKPDNAIAQLNKAYILLTKGEMAKGWELLEWRFTRFKPPFPQAHWQGKDSLQGKTIFLYADEGLGDAVQFSRYAKIIRDLGARVILEVQKPLANLLQGLQGTDQVIARGDPRPGFDYHCPMLSLPYALRHMVTGIPQPTPYLSADDAKVRQWAARIGDKPGLKIGLAWSGGVHTGKGAWRLLNAKRNIPLDLLAGTLQGVDAEFFSLQVGDEAEAELRRRRWQVWPRDNFHNFMDENKDFSDSAAIIANLDLMITADTSVAHVAAAMGKPAWILLHFDHDWRWQMGRDDSPWYESVKLYRQGKERDWAPVLRRVAADLTELARRS
jgi:tetratricopeptide (TPR) repeat protein